MLPLAIRFAGAMVRDRPAGPCGASPRGFPLSCHERSACSGYGARFRGAALLNLVQAHDTRTRRLSVSARSHSHARGNAKRVQSPASGWSIGTRSSAEIPWKSDGFTVNSGSSLAIAIAAMRAS